MSNFDNAVELVLKHEGGFVNNANDSGGATAFGISLRFLKDYVKGSPGEFAIFDIDHDGDIDADDIRGLSVDSAKHLYKKEFWDKNNYDNIQNYLIARKIFDLSVNMGSSQAHKILQRALRAASGIKLAEDGILGPKTLALVNGADTNALLAAMRSEAAGFYRGLAKQELKLECFLAGWLSRAYF